MLRKNAIANSNKGPNAHPSLDAEQLAHASYLQPNYLRIYISLADMARSGLTKVLYFCSCLADVGFCLLRCESIIQAITIVKNQFSIKKAVVFLFI